MERGYRRKEREGKGREVKDEKGENTPKKITLQRCHAPCIHHMINLLHILQTNVSSLKNTDSL